MRWIRFTLCLLVLLAVTAVTLAHGAEPPLLALRDDAIYAVSPSDGEVTRLIAAPNGAAVMRKHTGEPVTLFSADWLSPDGRTLVYRTLAADALARVQAGTYRPDHALYAFDLHNLDTPVEIALPNHASADVTVQSAAWTADGARLAVVLVSRSRENEDEAGWSLALYERETWEPALVAPLPEPGYAMSRRIVAGGDAFVMVDTGIQGPRIRFTRLDANGQALEPVEIDPSVSSVVNLYLITPFNPLLDGDDWRYGLDQQLAGDLFAGIDLASGELAPFDANLFPGLVSALAPETSLRLTASYYSGDGIGLLVRNAEGEIIGETPIFKAYAFGIAGDSDGSTFALSPDGQAVAFLEDGGLRLWRGGEVTALDFEAEALAWAPPRYVPVYDPFYLMG